MMLFLCLVKNSRFLSAFKGGFFSESAIRFLTLQISPQNIFQKTILNLKFKIAPITVVCYGGEHYRMALHKLFYYELFMTIQAILQTRNFFGLPCLILFPVFFKKT